MLSLPTIKLTYSSRIPAKERPTIKSSRDAYEILKGVYDQDTIEHVEHFYIICCNNAARCLGSKLISMGGVNQTVVDVKVVLQTALLCNATSIVLSHNHPSGNVTPSDHDKRITKQIIQASNTMGILVVDHIIMSADGYYSFADEGILH